MKKVTPWLPALAFAVLASGAGAAWAQPAPNPASDPVGAVQQDVAELNRSVKELVALLREYLTRQQVDLMFKRIELCFQKMGPIQEELRGLRARRSDDEVELNQLRTALAAREALEPQEEPKADEDLERDVRKVQLEAEIKSLRNRISQADQRILQLENELAQEQRNVQSWEAVIDQRLNPR